MTVTSNAFKNQILDCLEDVIFSTVHEMSDMINQRHGKRPNSDNLRKALLILCEEGVVEKRGKVKMWGRGHAYQLARTKPIIGSLRKAA